MSVDLVDRREGPKFHDAFKGQPQIPFGAAITFTVIKSVASLGPSQSAMLIVASQSVVSYLIEVFGLFGVEKTGFAWVKLLGVVLFVTGLIIFKWKS